MQPNSSPVTVEMLKQIQARQEDPPIRGQYAPAHSLMQLLPALIEALKERDRLKAAYGVTDLGRIDEHRKLTEEIDELREALDALPAQEQGEEKKVDILEMAVRALNKAARARLAEPKGADQ